jgi:hypothetical protein
MDDFDNEREEHVRSQHEVRGYNDGEGANASIDIDLDGLVLERWYLLN